MSPVGMGPRAGDRQGEGHIGELMLRRFRAGELSGAAQDEIAAHTARCPRCRVRLGALEDEQRTFERDIPFDRFAGGVERAARTAPVSRPRRLWLAAPALAAAAAILLVVRTQAPPPVATGVSGADQPGGIVPSGAGAAAGNRRKGEVLSADAAGLVVRVADASGAQRVLAPGGAPERLHAGERLRIGHAPGTAGHVVVLAIDGAGAVTALHPEAGTSAALTGGAESDGRVYLPGSIELTGSGREHIVAFFARAPFSLEASVAAVRMAYTAARGELTRLAFPANLTIAGVPVAAFAWPFEKP